MRESPDPLTLLAWYDRHARLLPWRTPPAARTQGIQPDAYRVWLSEIMLQQTTVPAVKGYFERFTATWPTVHALAAADDSVVMAAWAGLGYYARARNLLKCARQVVQSFDGVFPADRDLLLTLPGIGPYTASAIASIAFDLPATVVDGNVERVMARVFDIHTPLPKAKGELTALAGSLTPTQRPGDYAQAVMDLGATVCTPRSPSCGLCPWSEACLGRARNTAVDLPKKIRKPSKPLRVGTVYIVRRSDGAWLLEQRPQTGLLGGMLGWPGTNWSESTPPDCPPIDADWTEVSTQVRHVFTHFQLHLAVRIADVAVNARPMRGTFIPDERFNPSDLPTVMRKAFTLSQADSP
ncbi:A/G-specific adenine glycosylase [Pseudoruegeria sp. SK021]|uniref:A/G-specific adenine glycosylase n=1 Tax=Pseudoruegeria sp. SK021 TaxID=1933035 RepID=UPI000A24C3FC|nr:A/G-specific adenine glycosylase [Pseudoruegeria sp. SK021]OSP55074.1 A/G-specific adenine glycosylase [Pseudoruegeria sp. SK021]